MREFGRLIASRTTSTGAPCTVPPTTLLLTLHAQGMSAFFVEAFLRTATTITLCQQQACSAQCNAPCLPASMQHHAFNAVGNNYSSITMQPTQALSCQPRATVTAAASFTMSVMPCHHVQ
jgi:hypothetical protein